MNILKFKPVINAIIFITGIISVLISCQPSQTENYQSEINNIAYRYVSDKRLGICNINAETGTGGSIILKGETTIPAARNEITDALSKHGISLVDSILILPDTIKNNKFMGLVTLSVVNLRKEPDHRSELVSQAILGTPVMILKDENSWLLVQTPDNYISWTEKSGVTPMSTTEMNIWKHADRVIYLKNSGWIYSSPEESEVVGDLVAGCILKKTGEEKGFAKVALPDGREGFIEIIKLIDFKHWKSQVMCTEDNVCSTASTSLGLPYLWGGTSSKGVDCSGFVQSVFFMNGLILGRDASLQALHGIDIDISKGYNDLKKGDLLFFGSRENSIPHVTHVAIYTGNNTYINSSGRVMTNNLRTGGSSILSARRIIGVVNDNGVVPVIAHPWY